ncbi:hypothetical protein F183_A04520 [Bryobacterales bacterium F-183]|nr:hypothetical protein F183_A04520 [Bryobacterales bacterium F-183]
MPYFFFDTSGLAKRYQLETGSSRLVDLFATPSGRFLVSDLGILETRSALAMKVRTGESDASGALDANRRFGLDLANGLLHNVAVTRAHFAIANTLVLRHGLTRRMRTLDALQLAVAMDLRDRGEMDLFVVSDRILQDLATLEGLPVLNPEIE